MSSSPFDRWRELNYREQLCSYFFFFLPSLSVPPTPTPAVPHTPALTSVSRQLDPRVVFSEGDHEGRIFQNRLQFLPWFVLCEAERGWGVTAEVGEGRGWDAAQGGAWGEAGGPGGFLGLLLPSSLG